MARATARRPGAVGARERAPGLLVAVLVAAFNIRLAIASPGPVIDTIRADTGMSSAVAGILITIPFLCMSVFSFTGPPLIRRSSSDHVLVLALLLIGGGTVARAAAPSAALLIAATFPIGIGIALAGVALPVVVRRHFHHRSTAITGAYVASFSLGVVVVAIGIGPLADAVGGWRPAFAITAAPVAIALAIWFAVNRGVESGGPAPGEFGPEVALPARRLPRPDRTELLAAASFGMQSMCYAAMVGWVAALYIETGWSEEMAALTTASLGLFVIPGSLIFTRLSQHRDPRPWIASTVGVMSLGLLGVALAPDAAPLAWLVIFGVGSGAAVALQLALPIELRRTPEGIARLSAWMFGLGYVLSAVAPTAVGALRDATGGFTVPMTVLAVLAIGGVAVAMALPPPVSRHAPEPEPPAPI